MPTLRIETNIPKSKVPKDFGAKGAALLSKILGKPEAFSYVSVIPDVVASFGADSGPAGFAVLMWIGTSTVEGNKKYAAELYPFIEKELGIPQDKIYIQFQTDVTSNVGYKSTTFHTILGS